ncbi:MAG: sugar ABC transporter permease [Rhodospirillales bacterium]|jgi:multiple sugar transport system permease protein|nr:sugar ABC transporter permease [Rhodospirillales bacterium]
MRDNYKGYLFILPAFLMLVLILGFPAVAAVLQSFNLMWVSKPAFTVGAYQALAQDPEFLRSLLNTVLFVTVVVSSHLAIGLGVALLLNMDIRFKWLWRVVAILPWTMPDVIGGLVWRFMFDTLPGIVNSLLLRTGLSTEPIDWLGRPDLAFAAVMLAESWRGYPYAMLILLAGLQAIPRQQYEAAELDGCSAFQKFLYVTMPNLKHMFIIALVLDTIWESRLFGMVYSMTGGGPGYSTQILTLLSYKQYFQFFNISYGAAMAVVLATVLFFISLPYLRMSMRQRI